MLWECVEKRVDGEAYRSKSLGLLVIISKAIELDSHEWIHLSVSRRSRIPSYEDLALVKKHFLGDRHAYQCFVPESEHVNIHPYVLHLWARVDGAAVLPDFTRGAGSI